MNPSTRACVAYVAARLLTENTASAVFDHSRSKYISIDGSVNETLVNVYDYDRRCHFGGNGQNGSFNLYDYGGKHHVELKLKGKQFEGYDYGARCHFSGNVNGNSISLYDYGLSNHFSFSL